VNTISIVIFFVQQQFPLQISSSAERYLIEILPADRADRSFDERLRQRDVRYCLDLRHLENPEIGVPKVESEQRVMAPRGQPARSELKYRGLVDPPMMLLNIRHTVGPSSTPAWTAKSMTRRVNGSITTITQWDLRISDSHRKRSTLHKLSLL